MTALLSLSLKSYLDWRIKILLQTLHGNCFSLECVSLCFHRVCRLENVFPQDSQTMLAAGSSLCLRSMWPNKSFFLLNTSLHSSHVYCFLDFSFCFKLLLLTLSLLILGLMSVESSNFELSFREGEWAGEYIDLIVICWIFSIFSSSFSEHSPLISTYKQIK